MAKVQTYFVSEHDFVEFTRLRDTSPKAGFIWHMDCDMAAELEMPLPSDYPESGALT